MVSMFESKKLVLIVTFLILTTGKKKKFFFSKSKLGTGRFGNDSDDLAGKYRDVRDRLGSSFFFTGDDQYR